MSIGEYFDVAYAEKIGNKIKELYPAFAKDNFVAQVKEQLPNRTYTERLVVLASAMQVCIESYGKALDIFTAMLGPKMSSMREMYEFGMDYAPLGKFVELFATSNEGDFFKTVEFVYQLTQRYTGEFAMRPLLEAFPQKTARVILSWSKDQSDCVRRLCSECMRVSIPWGKKLNFALQYFGEYSHILITLATDKCEYVRRSVANNINELYKVDVQKANYLIGEIGKISNDNDIKKLITHATRWARKHGVL